MAKKLEIKTVLCDMRKVQEETLAGYESIAVNASLALVSSRVRALLAQYPVTLNCMQVLDLDEDVTFSTVNGVTELTGSNAPNGKQFLLVNGSLCVSPDAGDALRQYIGITVNGTLQCPRSLLGRMGNLQVNGKTYAYPDGAILLKRTAVLDPLFLLRARQGVYWAAKRIVAVDARLDGEALAARGVRFSAPEAILSGSLAPALAPLFDNETDLIVVPDGTSVVQDDLTLTDAALRRYGPKLYVLGDLTLTEDSRGAMRQLSFLHVNGDVTLPAALAEEFAALDAEYGELSVVQAQGRTLSGLTHATISRAMLLKEEDGLRLLGCAYIDLDEDIEPQLILERLTLTGCAHIGCTPEQRDALYSVASNCALIGDGAPEAPKAPDIQVIDGLNYVM